MNKASLQQLRYKLFDVMDRVIDGNDPNAGPADTIDLDRAKVIAGISKEIINSAKVEVDAMRLVKDDIGLDQTVSYLKQNGLIPIENAK